MNSTHHLKFNQIHPQESTDGGLRIIANKKNFPILQGMSLYKLVLNPKGVREPHWHANADELGYCLKGEVLINLYHTGDARSTFLVRSGEVFLIPSGALHHIENVGEGPAELILCFSSDDTEDFSLSRTISSFSNSVLGNTWHVESGLFDSFKRSTEAVFAGLRTALPVIPDAARYTTPYRYDLAGSQPILTNDGGSARMARQNFWSILKRQALYLLELTGKGMREPHWHPETAELGYVHRGEGRMSILSPSGTVDTYLMKEGDIYFIPKAYPHHIENLGDDPLNLLIFFDEAMPGDVGFTGSVRSYSNEVLAASTNNEPAFFGQLEKYYRDLFIVDKINR